MQNMSSSLESYVGKTSFEGHLKLTSQRTGKSKYHCRRNLGHLLTPQKTGYINDSVEHNLRLISHVINANKTLNLIRQAPWA